MRSQEKEKQIISCRLSHLSKSIKTGVFPQWLIRQSVSENTTPSLPPFNLLHTQNTVLFDWKLFEWEEYLQLSLEEGKKRFLLHFLFIKTSNVKCEASRQLLPASSSFSWQTTETIYCRLLPYIRGSSWIATLQWCMEVCESFRIFLNMT